MKLLLYELEKAAIYAYGIESSKVELDLRKDGLFIEATGPEVNEIRLRISCLINWSELDSTNLDISVFIINQISRMVKTIEDESNAI